MRERKRRAAAAALAATLALGLAGCGSTIPEAEPLETADVALNNESGETVLAYRMTRESVEEILGNPNAEDNNSIGQTGNGARYGQTSIDYTPEDVYDLALIDPMGTYNQVTVAYLRTTDPQYSTPRGISVGSSVDDVLEAYGAPTDAEFPNNDISAGPMEEAELDRVLEDETQALIYHTDHQDCAVQMAFEREDGSVTAIYMGVLDEPMNGDPGGDAVERNIPESEFSVNAGDHGPYLQLRNPKSMVHLFMGEPEAEIEDGELYPSELVVLYTDDLVTSFRVTDGDVSTLAGIGIGSSRDDILEAYGTPDPGRGESVSYTQITEEGYRYSMDFDVEDGVCVTFRMRVQA